ncbi:hypothetical protein FHR58_002359 [Xanthomonas arboricola]|nr:hypothetical protein [Xanthomonas arboricola]
MSNINAQAAGSCVLASHAAAGEGEGKLHASRAQGVA